MKPNIELVALTLLICCSSTLTGELLMITMGGTKSHKIPFWELAKGLIQRGHNVTLMSAFPADFDIEGLEEVTPASLVFYVRNYTDWDLVGARMRGEEPVSPFDIMRYPVESCDELLGDHETKELLRSRKNFELIILDGAFPECALGFVHHFQLPFMYINTVGFYTAGLSVAGNPMPFAVTPFFGKAFSDNMNIVERATNAAWHIISMTMHSITINLFLQDVLKKHFGPKMPQVYEMEKNVSFILQNGHFSVTYPRPYLPNVVEIACIHCKPAKPLRKDLEDFISGAGDAGFIFVSMGSSVRAANLPQSARTLLAAALGRLPQRVLWKYEGSFRDLPDLAPNVRLEKWLPQQDLLGHPKIRAFVTHGGLLSMFETVYHGVPVVTMPVFCDHDANAHKAELDGYAIKLELRTLTADILHKAIIDVIYKPTYRSAVRRRQVLLRDQSESPLAKAVFWTEYVMRHKGAPHLLSPAKDLNYFQYHMFDVIALISITAILLTLISCILVRIAFKRLVDQITKKHMVSLDKSKKE